MSSRRFLVARSFSAVLLAVVLGAASRSAPACVDLTLPVDASFSSPDGVGDLMTRDTTLFMLRGLLGPSDAAVIDRGESWLVDCERLSPELSAALIGALGADGTLDSRTLRAVFEARYASTIATRGHDVWIKADLAGLEAATRFETWPFEIVAKSDVKQKTRRIFRRPTGEIPRISVSQTLATDTGDAAAAVLETEVAVERESGIDWDFYAYNAAGALSDYSTFPAGERPSPRICIGCHYDGGTRGVGRFFP
jgi:hypothetical protein